jgi:hypothetical protein
LLCSELDESHQFMVSLEPLSLSRTLKGAPAIGFEPTCTQVFLVSGLEKGICLSALPEEYCSALPTSKRQLTAYLFELKYYYG